MSARADHLRVLTPQDIPEAQAIIRRLCVLQRDVVDVLDPSNHHAADCFCGEQGFWPLKDASYFRNELLAIDFIEQAVREKLAAQEAS